VDAQYTCFELRYLLNDIQSSLDGGLLTIELLNGA
jgi:hypothetical protein